MRSLSQKEAYKLCKDNGICVTEGCNNQSDGKARCGDCRHIYTKRKKIYDRDNAALNAARWNTYYLNNQDVEIKRKALYHKNRSLLGEPKFPSQKYSPTKHRKWRYGLSESDIMALLELQEYSCAICLHPFTVGSKMHVDHDHETGQVRGLTHTGCNQGIGMFAESIESLSNAIKYLERTQANEAFILGR